MENDTEVIFLKKLFKTGIIENVSYAPVANQRLKNLIQGVEVNCDDRLVFTGKVVDQTMTDFSVCSSDQNNFLVHRSTPLFQLVDWKVNALPPDVGGGCG